MSDDSDLQVNKSINIATRNLILALYWSLTFHFRPRTYLTLQGSI